MVYRVVTLVKEGSIYGRGNVQYFSFDNKSDAIEKGKSIISDWIEDMKNTFSNPADRDNWSEYECMEYDRMLDTHSAWVEIYDEENDECGNVIWGADDDDEMLDIGWGYNRY